ncbi:hypothetical protein CMK22_02045 [Candidatus Poribacteria bacterium]|nr:hypothetical protein [Candidatus Poribacteria bacterium]
MERFDFRLSLRLPEAYMAAVNLKDNQEFRYAYNYDDNGNNIFRIASMTKLLTFNSRHPAIR